MIRKILIAIFLSAAFSNAWAAEQCQDVNYTALSLDSLRAQATSTNSAAGMEDVDALIDLLAKNEPECLIAAFPSLAPDTKKWVLKRAHEMSHGHNCEQGYKPDYADMDWCQPSLREHKENCFDNNGKPFSWCKAYPPILEKLENMSHAHAH